jgi:hypothetical protein
MLLIMFLSDKDARKESRDEAAARGHGKEDARAAGKLAQII